MDRSRPLNIRVENTHCRLTRLDDDRYVQLAGNSVPIKEDIGFQMDLILHDRRRGKHVSLGEYYAAFEAVFGESGQLYDDYKGAFSFPFEVSVFKTEAVYLYLLNVLNWRSTVEFRFSKVISPEVVTDEMDRMVIRPPFSDEFSADDMNKVVAFLYGFVEGAVGTFRRFPIDEFVKKLESNLILFGYKNGAFFEEQYDDPEEFSAAWKQVSTAVKRSGAAFDKTAALRSGLADLFGPLPGWADTLISNATPAQIETWIRRASGSSSLASVFADVEPEETDDCANNAAQ